LRWSKTYQSWAKWLAPQPSYTEPVGNGGFCRSNSSRQGFAQFRLAAGAGILHPVRPDPEFIFRQQIRNALLNLCSHLSVLIYVLICRFRVRICVPFACLVLLVSATVLAQSAPKLVGYFPQWGLYNQPSYLVRDLVTSGGASLLDARVQAIRDSDDIYQWYRAQRKFGNSSSTLEICRADLQLL
jgi:hypothetical protein